MRRYLAILCLLLNLSVLLMPFDPTHAHVSSAEALSTDVHSGHTHDFDGKHEHDQRSPGDQVVELGGSISAQNTLQSLSWSDWIPLACLVALTLLVAQLCVAVFAPPPSDPKPASRHGYWRPPLRGPPAFSIR